MKNEKRNKIKYLQVLRSFKAQIIFLVLLTAHCFALQTRLLTALDFNFRPKGFVSIPMGEGNIASTSEAADGDERYSVGGGGELGFEIDLSTLWSNPLGLGYTLGVEGGMTVNPLLNEDQVNYSFYSLGGVAGLYFFPLSRLFTRIDGAIGVHQAAYEEGKSDPGLFFRYGGEIGFRFTPGFTIAANAGWREYRLTEMEVLNSGMYAGLTAQITINAGRGTGQGIGATLDQHGELYPVFMQLYQTNPIGSVRIRNTENAEIRNVRLFFRASGYTASEFLCGSATVIQRGRSAQLSLYADFTPDVLLFTDKGRIMGELVIRYTFLGQERETVRAVTLAAHNRNTTIAGDASALAAFISPTSPETLDFARFIAGLDRANRRPGHNANMQYAIWLLEGMRASNIRLGETYTDLNEVQFPAETLSFRTGSVRDLSLLFAAALEGVGISSAFIQVNDGQGADSEFLVAVSLNISQSAAESFFNGTGKILVIDENVWLPLSMSAFNDGFMASWTKAASVLEQIFTEGKNAEFVVVEEAWVMYPPAPLPELGRNIIRTDNAAATSAVNRAMQAYITQEINPLIQQTQSMANNAAQQNRLGILYQRSGRVSDAKAAYERAAALGSVPAMNNRGNLALNENDFAAAERWFRQALQRDPQNTSALRGIEQAEGGR
ncbi:MAG: tetratricopeptide repeat protein [Treponema sp.]|nr:tetratricopeptide repeat protein [Treponema sp.]